jgi:hypothetical protein
LIEKNIAFCKFGLYKLPSEDMMQKVNLVLRHYNKLKPINCTVISGDTNKLFTVEINDNEYKGLDMIKGDPLLIGVLNNDDSLLINGGSVVGVTQQEDKYIISSNEMTYMSQEMEKRQYERYPTSLLGQIKLANSNKREDLCLKDFSYAGMCIYSNGDFSIKDNVEVSIYLSNSVAVYDGTVMRKTKCFGRNEYGIQIIHRDKNSMYATQTQITSLIQNEKDLMYKHLLNSKFKI